MSYSRVLADNRPDSDAAIGMVDQIEMEISFAGNLSGELLRRGKVERYGDEWRAK